MVARSTKVVAASLVLTSLIALAGCPSEAGSLDGTQWRLAEWTVSSLSPADFAITAQFADGRVSGNGGVNSYSASCDLGPGDAFAVGQITATEMASADPSTDRAEDIFFTLLGQARSYKVSDGTLTLYDEGGNESLIFTAARSQGASDSAAGIAAVKDRREAELMAIPGVVGVGIGERDGKGVIVVYVEKMDATMEGEIPADDGGLSPADRADGADHRAVAAGTTGGWWHRCSHALGDRAGEQGVRSDAQKLCSRPRRELSQVNARTCARCTVAAGARGQVGVGRTACAHCSTPQPP